MPPDAHGQQYRAWRLRDSPEAVAARAADDPKLAASLEGRLADALVAYQESLMIAIQDVEEGMRSASVFPERDKPGDAALKRILDTQPGLNTLEGVQKRISALEESGGKLDHAVGLLARELEILANKYQEIADIDRPILQDVYNSVKAVNVQPIVAGSQVPISHERDGHALSENTPVVERRPLPAVWLAGGAALVLIPAFLRRRQLGSLSRAPRMVSVSRVMK